ncbi:MAG: hypothetical protein A3I01_00330 [Betaproteobacteria bacterium RIFCSPLOWO2_02_FULL_65_24]|nr:MAG: hypothetical protein A3I01_00330 [Betaproteobacteria bacterium RIFCSPLOWO2_02_FULL_65_24]OGA86313.1 MAG: hypothetical protein A3G27_10055 [Betaproteobacteria bacterium RIFCSPLOWO2_12_FULL_66_14]
MSEQDKVHGEGNYKASRDYNEATKKFVDSGKVDKAARAAARKDRKEEQQLQQAERIAKSRAKGEDADPELWNDDYDLDADLDIEEENLRRSGRND